MKPRFSNQRNHALTITEVLVIFAVVFFLAIFFLPAFVAQHNRPLRIECVSNLKQIGLAYRIWADDNGGKFPMEISVTNGGTMGLGEGRNTWINFLVMSNELSTPKILLCPADDDHIYATNFASGFSGANVSYFVGLDADTNSPQVFLSGDDNFEIGGISVKSGLLQLSTNAPIFWTTTRRKNGGNIGLADGSVQEITTNGLRQALQQTGLATNRLAIP